jgi:hypothetical protein
LKVRSLLAYEYFYASPLFTYELSAVWTDFRAIQDDREIKSDKVSKSNDRPGGLLHKVSFDAASSCLAGSATPMDEINYKGWRIDILRQEKGWKALIYRPSSLLHETSVPEGQDRHTVIRDAKRLIDGLLGH